MPSTSDSIPDAPPRAVSIPAPTYHDLHITTASIPRTSIFNLPYGLTVDCNRTSGWRLWRYVGEGDSAEPLAGEYAGADAWLVLDVAGHVIIDSRRSAPEDDDPAT